MRRGFNVKKARAYYAHQGLVERQPLPTHGRNRPVLLFAPKVSGLNVKKPQRRLPLPNAEPKTAAASTWGNGGLNKIFAANRSVNLSSEVD